MSESTATPRFEVRKLGYSATVRCPDCWGGKVRLFRAFAIAWNLYRCRTCAARREPERWWHLLGWKLTAGRFDPFGRSAQGRRPW